jgi:hypothetical protein
MNGTRLAWDVALLLLTGTSLFAGLTRLATAPLSAVLILLGAMALLMFPAASLCGTAVATCRPAEEVGIELHTAEAFRLLDKEKMNVRSKTKR